MSRYAIGIGIKRSGNLTCLPGAVSGAHDFFNWAKSQGYEAKLLTDEHGPVTFDQVFKAVKEAVDSEPERLLIFFAGHGSAAVHGDFWLLSNWEQDANQVVNISFSLRHAKRHPIKQIAVFADACRSPTADSAYLMGTTIFPSSETQPIDLPQVDLFQATRLGQIAQEVQPKGAEAFGVFTKLLLNALRCREEGATEIRGGQHYVTSQALGRWLNTTLPMESGRLPGGIVQMPEIQPTWFPDDNFYAVFSKKPAAPDLRPAIRSRKLSGPNALGRDVANKAAADAAGRLDSLAANIGALMSYKGANGPIRRFEIDEYGFSALPLRAYEWGPGVLLLEPGERDGLAVIRIGEALVLLNTYRHYFVRIMFDGARMQLIQYEHADRPRLLDRMAGGLPTPLYARLVAKAWLGERLTAEEIQEILAHFDGSDPWDPAQEALLAYHFDNIVDRFGLPARPGDYTSLDAMLMSDIQLHTTATRGVPQLTRSWAFLPDDGSFEELRALRPGLVSSLWSTFRADFEPQLRRLVEGKRS